jgi:hypothetical protein
MPNFLEQIVAEWYEIRGYFVRRNVNVGLRETKGGYEAELDVVAFNPVDKHLVHVEPSMDADSWTERERRFRKKFAAGQKHISQLFTGFGELPPVEPIALFVFGSDVQHKEIGGGRVMMMQELMSDIRRYLEQRSIQSKAVPEQFVILRSLLFAAHYWR